jgi:hypothetical protein
MGMTLADAKLAEIKGRAIWQRWFQRRELALMGAEAMRPVRARALEGVSTRALAAASWTCRPS